MQHFLITFGFYYLTVIASALARNPSAGQVVARVNILASDGWGHLKLGQYTTVLNNVYLFPQFSKSLNRIQKNFEGKLIGADRTKDLAVLKVILVNFKFLCFIVYWRIFTFGWVLYLLKFGLSTLLLKELNRFLILTSVCLHFRSSSNVNSRCISLE